MRSLIACVVVASAQDVFLSKVNLNATCADVPPDSSATCAQQQGWGKCGKDWMKGYCCQTCFGCSGSGCGSGPSPTPSPAPFPGGNTLPGGIGGYASTAYRCGIEGKDSTRQEMEAKITQACSGCTGGELATVLAIAMIESDKMDKSDTSKGTTGGSSNWCPYNLNMDYLGELGCSKSCAQGLGQSKSSFNIPACTKYLLQGLRGGSAIGDTCDFMHFHRYGTTGWNSGKGKGCGYESSSNCKGCSDYVKAVADGAQQIIANPSYASDGHRVCEKVVHVR